jgi:hypothetical protein
VSLTNSTESIKASRKGCDKAQRTTAQSTVSGIRFNNASYILPATADVDKQNL